MELYDFIGQIPDGATITFTGGKDSIKVAGGLASNPDWTPDFNMPRSAFADAMTAAIVAEDAVEILARLQAES